MWLRLKRVKLSNLIKSCLKYSPGRFSIFEHMLPSSLPPARWIDEKKDSLSVQYIHKDTLSQAPTQPVCVCVCVGNFSSVASLFPPKRPLFRRRQSESFVWEGAQCANSPAWERQSERVFLVCLFTSLSMACTLYMRLCHVPIHIDWLSIYTGLMVSSFVCMRIGMECAFFSDPPRHT